MDVGCEFDFHADAFRAVNFDVRFIFSYAYYLSQQFFYEFIVNKRKQNISNKNFNM